MVTPAGTPKTEISIPFHPIVTLATPKAAERRRDRTHSPPIRRDRTVPAGFHSSPIGHHPGPRSEISGIDVGNSERYAKGRASRGRNESKDSGQSNEPWPRPVRIPRRPATLERRLK